MHTTAPCMANTGKEFRNVRCTCPIHGPLTGRALFVEPCSAPTSVQCGFRSQPCGYMELESLPPCRLQRRPHPFCDVKFAWNNFLIWLPSQTICSKLMRCRAWGSTWPGIALRVSPLALTAASSMTACPACVLTSVRDVAKNSDLTQLQNPYR